MSLVGTRPPTVDEWDKYELHHRARLATKPGLTGMWQVSGRSNITDFEEVVKLDKQYISEWTIYHVAPVTVNKDARIGKNCSIFGNVCIGVSDSGVPSIGNNCTLGYGSKVIGGVKIANNCIIGAGSVVTKSVEEEYSRIAGIPAKRL